MPYRIASGLIGRPSGMDHLALDRRSMGRKGQKQKKRYYAVIASKRRRGPRYAMVLTMQQRAELSDLHYPVYLEKPRTSRTKAEEELTGMLFSSGQNARRIEFSHFMLLTEQLEPETTAGTDAFCGAGSDFASVCGRLGYEDPAFMGNPPGMEAALSHGTALCFYDSEFGMYNYGELPGDVVLMGAVIPDLRASTAEGGQERDLGQEETGDGTRCFRMLVQNLEDAQTAERFQNFTGLRREDLRHAPPFPEVFTAFQEYLKAHNVGVVYCLGGNDVERLRFMLEKYGMLEEENLQVLSKFRNFQKWLTRYESRIASFSLESLASLCGVTNARPHDAFSDAVALSEVWRFLSQHRITEREIRREQEAAKERNRYRKNRKVSFERMPVPEEVIRQKDALLRALREKNQEKRVLSENLLRALCDDLDALLVLEDQGKLSDNGAVDYSSL